MVKIWLLNMWANIMLKVGNVEKFNETIDKIRAEKYPEIFSRKAGR